MPLLVVTRTCAGHGFRDEAATPTMHDLFVVPAVDTRHVLADPPGEPAVADLVVARAAGPLPAGGEQRCLAPDPQRLPA